MRISFTLIFLMLSQFLIGQITQEHFYLGTGEYSPINNWHGILQFNRADTMNSMPANAQYSPSSTIPVKQCYHQGVQLNFAHGFYLWENYDALYTATIFTNANNILTNNPDTAKGSIAIFDSISNKSGPQTPNRHIFGDSTQLKQPHAVWVDESRQLIYVANTFGESILVFDNARNTTGNRPPSRVIPIQGRPVYVYVDAAVNRMFVAVMPNGLPGVNPKVEIFNNASTLNGPTAPNIRIEGNNTRLNIGNPTVHNLWFNAGKQLLAVGHHTNELLLFNLNSVNWGAPPTQNYNLIPRVIRMDDPASGIDSNRVNLYGFFWDTQRDLLFASIGINNPGGGPQAGSPPQVVKVYANVSDSLTAGFVTPQRTLHWNNGNIYYPPQPIWVRKTLVMPSTTNEQAATLSAAAVKIYPQPAQQLLFIDLEALQESIGQLILYNSLGQKVWSKYNPNSLEQIDISQLATGHYILRLFSQNTSISKSILVAPE